MGLRLPRILLFGVAALALALPFAVHAADEDDDHDLARDLHENGEIRALAEILQEVSRTVPGEIVAVDLVRGNDKWVYRIQLVTADGQRRIVEVDAGKGTVFHDEGRD